MVRINLIDPVALTDAHLVAEYREILLLFGYVRKYPEVKVHPEKYILTNPLTFFKDKLKYLGKRFNTLVQEMKRRGFKPQKKLNFNGISNTLINDWKPSQEEVDIVKQRIIQRINEKPDFYRYYGKYIPVDILISMIQNVEVIEDELE